jgi:hypothetical protein
LVLKRPQRHCGKNEVKAAAASPIVPQAIFFKMQYFLFQEMIAKNSTLLKQKHEKRINSGPVP